MSTATAEFAVLEATVEVKIDAPPERVWEALVEETRFWWHRDYYNAPEPRGLVIEPTPGGRMYEDWGDGQGLLWGHVTVVRAREELTTSGELSAEFGGPARQITRIRLTPGDGATLVTLEDCIYGRASEQTRASLESGWKFLFEQCLKPYVERGDRPEIPASVR